jgi:3-dehydroquinate dehydratase-2
MKKVMILSGPNLNRLGSREPEIYGSVSYTDLVSDLSSLAVNLGVAADIRQSNDEAELINWLHEAIDSSADVIINPAAFTHYSYALRDAAAMVTSAGLKLIEVHISNPHAREEFRQKSVISGVATGVIAGFGVESYALALRFIAA